MNINANHCTDLNIGSLMINIFFHSLLLLILTCMKIIEEYFVWKNDKYEFFEKFLLRFNF